MKNMQQANQESGKDLKRVFNILTKNKLLNLLIIMMFLIGGIIYTYLASPVYETYTTLEISNDKLDMSLSNMVRRQNLREDETLMDTEVEIIRSHNLIEKALDKVGYSNRYFLEKNYKSIELYTDKPIKISNLKVKNPLIRGQKLTLEVVGADSYRLYTKPSGLLTKLKESILGANSRKISLNEQHKFGESINNEYVSMKIEKVKNLNNGVYSVILMDSNEAIKDVSKRLSVFSIAKNGSIIKLIFQDNDAQRAKDFLDNLVEIYLAQNIDHKTSQASTALTFVNDQVKKVNKKLAESAVKLENYKEENNLINIDTESDVTLRSLSNYQAELSTLKIQESAFNALYEEFKRGNYGSVSSLAREYPVLGTLLGDLQKAKSDKITLLTTLTEEHPDAEKSNEKIEDIQMALESAIEGINDGIREKKRSLEDTLYTKETMLLKLPEKERELAALQRKYNVHEKTYQFLLEKQAEMSINKASTVSSNRVLDHAIVEKRPVKPNAVMIVGTSLLLGLISALLISFLRDFLDNKIVARDDISKNTKIPFYGVIPSVRSSEPMFVLEDQQSVASEALRLIRTNLEFIPTANKGKVIVVTSTVPGEGKTTISTNLSAVFGMGDKKCIVISLDMRRPMLHKIFSLTNKVGMSTVLSKNNDIKEVIWEHKKIKNLDIITSGPIPPNPSELMQTGRIDNIINVLRDEYDYIIIDAPPMGSITDSLILMKNADISLVVFRSEFSEKEYIKSLEEMITSYKIDNVGIVLNAVKPKNMSQSFFKYSYTYK